MSTAQIVLLAITAIAMLLHANKHGQPKKGNENFWIYLVSVSIGQAILYWGGWYDNLLK